MVEDEGLEVRSGGAVGTTQPQCKRRVAPVELRALDQPLGTTDGKRLQAHQLEGCFEQIEIALHRHPGNLGVAAESCLVDDRAETRARSPNQPPKINKIVD